MKTQEIIPTCPGCGARCGPKDDRVFDGAEERWYCGSCTYKREYGHRVTNDGSLSPPMPRRRRSRSQDEKLFDLPEVRDGQQRERA